MTVILLIIAYLLCGVLVTLVKLGGEARFTPLEQVAVQGRVTRTDEPDGTFTLRFDAARAAHTQEEG